MRVLILGATNNPDRYAYKAAHRLINSGHEIIPVGIKKGDLFGVNIINNKLIQDDIDTITLYLGQKNQIEWYDYILDTKPRRVIFNPGAENQELEFKLKDQGVLVENNCTLVMLSLDIF